LKWLNAKVLAAAVAFAFIGCATLFVAEQLNTRRSSVIAAVAPPAPARTTNKAVSGILKTPDGRPLANARVYLSTESVPVPVYAAPPAEVGSAVSGADGRFSFPAEAGNCAVIVLDGQGYGQATVAEL